MSVPSEWELKVIFDRFSRSPLVDEASQHRSAQTRCDLDVREGGHVKVCFGTPEGRLEPYAGA